MAEYELLSTPLVVLLTLIPVLIAGCKEDLNVKLQRQVDAIEEYKRQNPGTIGGNAGAITDDKEGAEPKP